MKLAKLTLDELHSINAILVHLRHRQLLDKRVTGFLCHFLYDIAKKDTTIAGLEHYELEELIKLTDIIRADIINVIEKYKSDTGDWISTFYNVALGRYSRKYPNVTSDKIHNNRFSIVMKFKLRFIDKCIKQVNARIMQVRLTTTKPSKPSK